VAQKCIFTQTSCTNIILVFNKYFVQYHHSTCQTAIIYEKDDDFADITVPDMTPSISQTPLLSQRIDPSHLSHLDFQQQETLLNVLGSFSDCFSDIPAFCSLEQLCCKTTAFLQDLPNFALRFRHSFMNYNHWGIICPSKSPMATPVICDLKGRMRKGACT